MFSAGSDVRDDMTPHTCVIGSGRLWRCSLMLCLSVLTLSCMHNRPDSPAVPVGPTSVEVDSTYTYKASASNGKQYEEYGLVWVRFAWGDGDTSMWCGHGETVECSHSWKDGGVFAVRAQAHDDRPGYSEWSAPCKVTCVVPPYPYRIVDSVTACADPTKALVLSNGEFVYVATEFDASLTVVRTSDLQVVAQIPFFCSDEFGGVGGGRMACSPGGRYVYATYYRYYYLAVVRTTDRIVADSLFLGSVDMSSIAVSPDGKQLFVAVDEPSYIVVVKLPDNIIEDTIPTLDPSSHVSSMKVSPDGTRLYVVDQGSGRVCCIRLSDKSIEWQVPADVCEDPAGALVLPPSGNPLYVLETGHISVRESGTGAVIDTIPNPSAWTSDPEVAPDGSYIYVACIDSVGSGTVSVLRTADNKVVSVRAMPGAVYDASPSPDGQRLYVAADNGKLYVLSR